MSHKVIYLILAVVCAGLCVWIEKRTKRKANKFVKTTNDTLVDLWTRYVKIEGLHGTCQVNFEKTKTENWRYTTFDFFGMEDLCEQLSKFSGYKNVAIYPRNVEMWCAKTLKHEDNTGTDQETARATS